MVLFSKIGGGCFPLVTLNEPNKESGAQNAKSKVFATLLPSFAGI